MAPSDGSGRPLDTIFGKKFDPVGGYFAHDIEPFHYSLRFIFEIHWNILENRPSLHLD